MKQNNKESREVIRKTHLPAEVINNQENINPAFSQ